MRGNTTSQRQKVTVKRAPGEKARITLALEWDKSDAVTAKAVGDAFGELLKKLLTGEEAAEFLEKLTRASKKLQRKVAK